jgi:hypothetical protein
LVKFTFGNSEFVGIKFDFLMGVGKTMLLLSVTFRRIFIPIKQEVHMLMSNTNKLTYIRTLSHAETSYVNV